jgi:cytoskeleton protein RodZ
MAFSGDTWRLASLRHIKGISLEEIAQHTKLRVTILQAIEDANFKVLPGGLYNISYLRQYARAIGADETSLVQLYEKSYADPVGM